jgi:hypothetical protein
MVVCPEPTQHSVGTKIQFQGEIVTGLFRGAELTGTVAEDEEGDVWLQMRVQWAGRGGVEVEFAQPLKPIELEDHHGPARSQAVYLRRVPGDESRRAL